MISPIIYQILHRLFNLVNQNNGVPYFNNLFLRSILQQLQQIPPTSHCIDLGQFYSLRPLEAVRILGALRQRFGPLEQGSELVGRVRAEVRERLAPERNIAPKDIAQRDPWLGELAAIGGHPSYSEFQIAGWEAARRALNRAAGGQPAGLILTAPTGGGKTEAFLLPLVYYVASTLAQPFPQEEVPRFMFLYPRKALVQDQIRRVFRYVRQAERRFQLSQHRIVVGLQLGGIWSRLSNTLQDEGVFENQTEFKLIDECPWCGQSSRLKHRSIQMQSQLYCSSCQENICVSLSKEDHGRLRPHFMLTTAEALDRMFFDADFRDYLPSLHGVVLDEAHLYHGLYGAHIAHLLNRLREEVRSQGQRELMMIISSATIPDPTEFAGKLLFRGNPPPDALISVEADQYPMSLWGLEIFCFLQAPRAFRERALSTMIQAAMAMGHAVLGGGDRMLIFVDSLDAAGRLHRKLKDAEQNQRLWSFRVVVPQIWFNNNSCPHSNPSTCSAIYWEGECWRGVRGGSQCHTSPDIRASPLSIQQITGRTMGSRALMADIVIGTSALEVGIDDPTIQATLHYRPPRTVFEFIQRRGRAGRSVGSLAYTVVVLGQEPSDHFYLFRRHRLIDGRYELPLNPDNEVVREIHRILDEARQGLIAWFDRLGREPEALWHWTVERLAACPYLVERYEGRLRACQALNQEAGWNQLKEWVGAERRHWEDQMGIMWRLPELRWQFRTPEARERFEELYEAVNAWLKGDIEDEQIKERLHGFREWGGEFMKRAMSVESGYGSEVVKDVQTLIRASREVEDWIRAGREGAVHKLEEARTWHDFFEELQHLFDSPQTRYVPADVVRIICRAMYFLHEGHDHHGCPSDVSVYVPDAYFESIRPIRVEAVNRAGEREIQMEPQTYLASLFAPYRTSYRYAENLSVLDGRTIPQSRRRGRWGGSIAFRAYVEGPEIPDPSDKRRRAIWVRRLSVREISSNDRDEVGLCVQCYQIHDWELTGGSCGNCGGQGTIRPGTIYVKGVYVDHGLREIKGSVRVGHGFEGLPSIRVWSCVRGSHVFFRETASKQEHAFYVWLSHPLYFELRTRGIRWQVPGLPDAQTERLQALHTAAHLLLRVMAAVTGVREDQLGYTLDPEAGAVVIWEKFEGGAGLSEVFLEVLQRDPLTVYREMVAVAACPIYWAEQKNKLWSTDKELRDLLSRIFHLSPDDPVIRDIAQEAMAESARGEGQPTCSQEDGCPVCVETLECASRGDNEEAPKASRTMAERLVASLVRRIPSSDWGQEGIPGPVIWADEERGEHVVLVL